MTIRFNIIALCNETDARRGILETAHGSLETPAFMPVATQGTVKSLSAGELEELNTAMILSNAYHLYLRPGTETVARAGGLHRFMNWQGGILTDSGGFQVFSLQQLRKIDDRGVTFVSHIDGSSHFLTPERVTRLQNILGSDIAMVLDQCPPYPCAREQALEAVERTTRWAWRSLQAHQRREQAQFGIIQGGVFSDLRELSANELVRMDFPGYAIGGLSVGEPKELMYRSLETTVPLIPDFKPRYLMGVGSPDALLEAVKRGVDIFDSVLPTRIARNGRVMTENGYLTIRNAVYAADTSPLDRQCRCPVCQSYSRAYIRHLLNAGEILGMRLTTYHNLYHLAGLMKEIREAISENRFAQYYEKMAPKLNQLYGGVVTCSTSLDS